MVAAKRKVGAAVRVLLALILLGMVSACAVVQTPQIIRVALFAPFEGRYREIGYNALYAARLALADANYENVELLPVDDGGTQAASHARALALDPQVLAVVALGYDATRAETLAAFGDLPLLVVGGWGAESHPENLFILSNRAISEQVSVSSRISVTEAAALPAPLTGGEVFALESFAALRADLTDVVVLSSGALPDDEFAVRYRSSDPFAPEPGLLATLTYDATTIALNAAQTATRTNTREYVASTRFTGINGTFQFQDNFWRDAPIWRYRYLDGLLTHDPIE